MKRRILFINAVLLCATVLLAYNIRQNWLAAQARERAILRAKPAAAVVPVPPLTPAPQVAPAAGYADLAMRTLFAKDRNPNVIQEPPPPPSPPPPVPPFPYAYGVMDLGDGPMIAMAPRGGKQKFYQKGAQVGEFKLVDIRPDHIVLEWNDKTFDKKLADLVDRSGGVEEDRRPSASPNAPPIMSQAPTPPPITKGEAAPGGVDIGGGIKSCNAGDASPSGTVVGGMRKIVTSSPFGATCRWEPIR